MEEFISARQMQQPHSLVHTPPSLAGQPLHCEGAGWRDYTPLSSKPKKIEDSFLPALTKGKKSKQKIAMVDIEKIPRKSSGLILSKRPYVTDDAQVVGFIVVGVVRANAVYSSFQDDKIRMCDIIETVNGKPCPELNYPTEDLQKTFEQHIADRSHVSLQLSHCIALPPVSSALAYAKKKDIFYTHAITLMYTREFDDSHYGLILNKEFVVQGVTKDSPADISRIMFDDQLLMYVTESKDKDKLSKSKLVSEKTVIQVLFDLERAHGAGRNVVLFIVRSNVSEI